MKLDNKTLDILVKSQKNEILEYHVYINLAKSTKASENKAVLLRIAGEELGHYIFWKKFTGDNVKPNKIYVLFYTWVSKIFGITFGIKLMEKREEAAHKTYTKICKVIPEAVKIVDDEDEHEKMLISMINEERLKYVGSIVLGLNDALVELTGALAGFTFALQNTKVIAFMGLITGIAASFSMAASEYLSARTENSYKMALKSSAYTGCAYVLTVVILIMPFIILHNYYLALISTITLDFFIIYLFNFYISVAKDLDFMKRFAEMAIICLSVALVTFIISYAIKGISGIEI